MAGPLNGIRVLELAGLGPTPFCGMVLADLGAEVIRVDRPPTAPGLGLLPPQFDLHNRGKRSIAVDMKHPGGVGVVLDLVERSDVLIEGLRPGVTERLGVGPAECLARNPALVYGRMTGWGQDGPYAETAGHDIDYIAVSGLLHAIGTAAEPAVPLNMIGDFGGGGMLLVVGVLAAAISAKTSGVGQVVDAAMVDGSALLSTSIHGLMAAGVWEDRRQSNLLDGGAPFYAVYATSDSRHMAVGALEPQFFQILLEGLEIDECPPQMQRDSWDQMRMIIEARFRQETQEFWTERFAGSDGCVVPVRSLTEAPRDKHLADRSTFVSVDGVIQPAPAPRFSSTPGEQVPGPPCLPGQHNHAVLEDLGYNPGQISKLIDQGVVVEMSEES